MEEKLRAQRELQIADFRVVEERHKAALADAKQAWAEDMEKMKVHQLLPRSPASTPP